MKALHLLLMSGNSQNEPGHDGFSSPHTNRPGKEQVQQIDLLLQDCSS